MADRWAEAGSDRARPRSAAAAAASLRRGGLPARLASALLAAALAPACAATATPAPPVQAGTLPGSFAVTPNGDASYSIPIEVPPGIDGAQPRLSLQYRSNRQNGRLGIGWSLEGLSSIHRCKASQAYDGFNGTIGYDGKDRFCLDGQRLINISGAYGAAGSVYRTALETWRKVEASADRCGSGPCSFQVTAADGRILSYGATPDSRIKALGRPDVRLWALSQVLYPNGNAVSITYSADPLGQSGAGSGSGQYYATRVDYTANGAAGVRANRSVGFLYAARPDVETSYQGGAAVGTLYRLANIQTFAGGQMVRDYRLAYAVSQASGRSQITSITTCAAAGTGAPCLTATNFAWQGNAIVQYRRTDLQASTPAGGALLPGDVGGDGLGDVIALAAPRQGTNAQAVVYKSTGSGLRRCPTPVALNGSGRSVGADVNGDGRLDLVQLAMSGGQHVLLWYYGQADGCSFVAGGTFGTNLPSIGTSVWPMDFNGDGRTDVVEGRQGGSTLTVSAFASTGSGFARTAPFAITTQGPARMVPMDVNGDGMADLVQIESNATGEAFQLTAYRAGANGFGAGVVTRIQPTGPGTGFLPVDINGDGNFDLVQSISAGTLRLLPFIADGAGRFIAGTPLDTGRVPASSVSIWPMDANGDGKTDLVQAWKSGGSLRLALYGNSGTGYGPGTDLGVQIPQADLEDVFPFDLAGDGRMQVLQAWTNGGNRQFTLFGTQQPSLDRVASITDGMGNRTSITYLPMSNPQVYTPDGGTSSGIEALGYAYRQAPSVYPVQGLSGGKLQLVAQYQNANAPSLTAAPYSYSYTFRYAGARLDLTGHGWLGFASVARTDNQTGTVRTDVYNQDYPINGTVAATLHACTAQGSTPDPLCPASGATTLSSAATTYVAVTTAKGVTTPFSAVSQVLKSKVQFDAFTYGNYDSSRARSYRYDNFGQLTLLSELGYVSRSGTDLDPADNVFTCTRYLTDGGGQTLGLPTGIKTSSSSACTNFAAFDPATDFSLEQVAYSPALEIAGQSTWDSGNAVFLETRYQHDAVGNVAAVSRPGNLVTTYGYDPAYRTYAVTITSPANAAGTPLVFRYAHDPRFGTLVGTADANGAVSLTCMGPFGELRATQIPLPAPSATADANCLGPITSGGDALFTGAQVVTSGTQSYGRDPAGGVALTRVRLQGWTTGPTPDTRFSITRYDGLGRAFQTVQQGDAATGNIAVCSILDSRDRAVRRTEPYFLPAAGDDCPAGSTPGRYWTSTAYDAYGRVTRTEVPAGATGSEVAASTIAYPTTETAVVTAAAGDPYAIQKTLGYRYVQGLRKLVRMEQPDGTGAVSTFGYDLVGRLTRAVDPPTPANPQGVANTIAYDSLGRRTSLDNPDQNVGGTGPAAQWRFDPATGFLSSITDARGQASRYAHDALGRVTTQSLADGTRIAYRYDDPKASYGQARLTGESVLPPGSASPNLAYSYAYDSNGRRTGTELNLAGHGEYSTTVQYDPLSRLTAMTYPDGSALGQSYRMGNLVGTRLDGAPYAAYSNFTPFGSAQAIAHGNGVAVTRRFAPTGQLTGMSAQTPGGQSLLEQTIAWDHLFQVTAIADNLKPGADYSQTFTHQAGRLVGAEAPGLYGRIQYRYDASGNLIARNEAQYSYAAHRVTSVAAADGGRITIDYDQNGNIRSKEDAAGRWTYSYDPLNRLTGVALGGAARMSMPVIDPSGRRLVAVAPGGITSLYAAPGYVVTQYPGGSVATRTVPGEGAALAAVSTTLSGTPPANPGSGLPAPGTLYLISDYLGTTQLATNADGLLVSRLAYDPYGAVIAPGAVGPDGVRDKFQGKELDAASGLYQYGARYYDPALGRFTTPDTRLASRLDRSDTLNRFAFGLNDPVTNRDSSGHDIIDSIVGDLLGALQVVAGAVVDVLSEGALEPLGNGLINGGISTLTYSIQDRNNFSWKQFGAQEGIGFAMGLVTPGFGDGGEAGAMTDDAFDGEEIEMTSMGGAGASSGAARFAGQDAEAAARETAIGQSDLDGGALRADDLSEARGSADESSASPEDGAAGEGEQCETASRGDPPRSAANPALRLAWLAPAGPGAFRLTLPGGWYGDGNGGMSRSAADAGGFLLPDFVRQIRPKGDDASNPGHADHAQILRGLSCRLLALGRTPGKRSATGRKVWERWSKLGSARRLNESEEVFVQTGIDDAGKPLMEWKPFNAKIHMGHIKDGVVEWNGGSYGLWRYGAKSKEARAFMLDSTNYRFEWGPLNSSNGAKLGMKYRRPLGWRGPWPNE